MTGDIPSSGVTRSGMLLKSLSSELSHGGGYTRDFGWYSWTVGCPLSWSGGEVGEVLSWSSSSSELISKGASWIVNGVASLAFFLGFGLHSSSSSFLILLSCTYLEKWVGQGPDMRPSALGLYFLVGLGGPTTSSVLSLSSSSSVKTDTFVCLLLCKSVEFVLGYLVWGVVFVPRLPPGG